MHHEQSKASGPTMDWLEQAGFGASALCLVHCAGLPLLLSALPALSKIISLPESFHVWVLAFAVPISGLALFLGHRGHRTWLPLVAGGIGLSLLAVGAIVLLGGRFETPVTIVGSLFLVAAHVMNWRRRHDRRTSCTVTADEGDASRRQADRCGNRPGGS